MGETLDKAVMVYKTDKGEVKLSPGMVRHYLASGNGAISDQEVVFFMQICKYQGLNPWLREAYLIKYGDRAPASIVVGKDVFTQRAAKDARCNGYRNGVIVQKQDGSTEYRDGSFALKEEKIVGGWAEVYRKDWTLPLKKTVSFDEYAKRNRDGELVKNWKEMPGTMIAKVALVQALREALPDKFVGLYDAEEIREVHDVPEGAPVAPPVEDPAPPQSGEPAPSFTVNPDGTATQDPPQSAMPGQEQAQEPSADVQAKIDLANRPTDLYFAYKGVGASADDVRMVASSICPGYVVDGKIDLQTMPFELFEELKQSFGTGRWRKILNDLGAPQARQPEPQPQPEPPAQAPAPQPVQQDIW